MNEIIQIKCPFDGAVLSVRNQPGIETKNVTCPICKHKFPFAQFKRVKASSDNDEPDTEYPDEESTGHGDDSMTKYDLPKNFILGNVKLMETGMSYQLRLGRNVIGRKASRSEANIQIDTAGKRMMSREHIIIEVKNVPAKGLVHCVSLFKDKINKTFIGNTPLIYGDRIILSHGDIIKLPDATLIFEIPDEEVTEHI